MTRIKNKKPLLPATFIVFLIISIIGISIYIFYPNDIKKIQKTKTYEEKLEYRTHSNIQNNTEENTLTPKKEIQKEITSQPQNTQAQTYTPKTATIQKANYKKDKNFQKLLDELIENPIITQSPEIIVKRILEYKGYKPDIIEIQYYDNPKMKSGSYIAGYFHYPTGKFNINKEVIEKTSKQEAIAIIAHELDHFDKIAQICKYMGTDNFEKFLKENNAGEINKDFWQNAQEQADITDFDGKYYQDSLQRYLNQNKIEIYGIYSYFYKIAEMLRNPLEIHAYEFSDFILNYYKIGKNEGIIKKFVKEFNNFDWEIYRLSMQNQELSTDRTALFDYYIQEVLYSNEKYKGIINNCITNKNGDLTELWETIKKDYNNFEQPDEKIYSEMTELIKNAEQLAQKGLNNEIIKNSLKYKYYTQISHKEFSNSTNQIKKSAENYITFLKENKIESPKDELDLIITLIKIENTKILNQNKVLFYIKLPVILEDLYNAKNKRQRFNFIYKNPEFKKLTEQRGITEQQLLEELIKK